MFIFGILFVFALGFILAPNETNGTDTNQTQQNNTNNQTNQTLTCDEDEDCASGYECENHTCILEDDDDDSNETDENETNDKVCCNRYRIKNNGTEGPMYNFIDRDDCLSYGDENHGITHFSEIVNDSMCGQNKERNREKQRIHFEDKTGIECPDNCTCMGVVMKCVLEDGTTEMKVFAGKSGNIIIQIKGINVSTEVTLYKDKNGTLYGNFTGGQKRIKYMPGEAKAKFKEKVKGKFSEDETEIKLDEDGNYKVQTRKEARLLWIFKVKEGVTAEISAENGELVHIENKWWGFLAKDSQ